MAHCAGITDSGIQTATTAIRLVSDLAIAAGQFSLAKQASKRADRLHAAWADNSKQCEYDTITAECAKLDYIVNYKSQFDSAKLSNQTAFAQSLKARNQAGDKWCLGSGRFLDHSINVANGLSLADTSNYGFRFEEDRKIRKTTENLNKKMQMFNIYKGSQATSLNMFNYANATYVDSGNSFGNGLNIIQYTAGYFNSRSQTEEMLNTYRANHPTGTRAEYINFFSSVLENNRNNTTLRG